MSQKTGLLSGSYQEFSQNQRGGAGMTVLVVLILGALGVAAQTMGYIKVELGDGVTLSSATSISANVVQEDKEKDDETRVPGSNNPVVARIGGEDVYRLEVFAHFANLPENIRQQPLERLYPIGLQQLLNSRLIEIKTKGVNLKNDSEFIEQMAEARTNIVRTVFLKQELDARVSNGDVRTAYEKYAEDFDQVDEARARHILVEDEKLAQDLLSKLEGGADFVALAKEHSTDGSAQNGGDLGFFAKSDVVEAFGDAVFGAKAGALVGKPIKSEFGYHLIMVEEKRKRPIPSYEEVKGLLEPRLRQQALNDIFADWEQEVGIEVFDINGNPVAAQEEIEPDASAEETAPAAATAAE